MIEILNIPDVRARVAPITIDRYHRMIDSGVFDEWDVELLNGVLVEKMSKSELHFFLVQYLFQRLLAVCPPDEYLIGKEDPITIGDSEPEPDISVVRGTLARFRNAKPTTAELVIEVSISSLAIDRAKAGDYAKAGIPEYWIVRPEAGLTEVCRLPVNGQYSECREVAADEEVSASELPGFSFCLKDALG